MQAKGRLNIIGQESPKMDFPAVNTPRYEGAALQKVAFVTLGCSKNTVDSEVMMGSLVQHGFVPVSDPASADMIVVNTCAFLESAVEEGIDKILELSEYKKSGECKKLVVAGCMVERFRSELRESLPEVDSFITTDEVGVLAELVDSAPNSSVTSTYGDKERKPYFLYNELTPRVLSTPAHYAYVKVAEGCNRPCTFCIIPKIRGALRSRSIESVSTEVKELLGQGVQEVNLIAQDLTSYGTDLTDSNGIKNALPELIKSLEGLVDREYWVRLFYAYPIGTNEALINAIANSTVVVPYLDIPLQHISGNVLTSMRRPLGEKKTRALVEKVKTLQPSIHLRTTFVVGFPGEKDEDVDLLEAFIREGFFTHVGVFTYSQEKEAVAYQFSDQVENEVKEERRDRLMQAQQEVVFERQNKLIGSRQRVLVEGLHPESDMLWSSRARFQGPEDDGLVIINNVSEERLAEAEGGGGLEADTFDVMSGLEGSFQDALITEAAGYDLVATLL